MIKNHNLKKQSGFTIVELLIVIVVIGILAALVLNSFSGVQAKARDTERATDVKALSTQLEAFYNGDGQGSYPLLSQINTDTLATGLLKGIDANTLHAPGTTTATSLQGTAAGNKDQYGYIPLTVPGGVACALVGSGPTTTCGKFTLTYFTEASGLQTKTSLNQ